MIKVNKVTMEESDRSLAYTHINKISFFYAIDNLLRYKIIIFKQKDFLNMYNYYKKSKCYLINLFKLEKRFLLFSKEIFTIIINIFEYYEKSEKEKVINEYIKVIKKIMFGDELLLNKKYNQINNDLLDINNSLKVIFGENSDKNFRIYLLKIIFPENKESANKALI